MSRPPPSYRTTSSPPAARHAAPVSARQPAPIQIQDFAFADTVFADELTQDELAPPSGSIFVNDSRGDAQAHCVTPLAFRLPDAGEHVDLATRLRVLSAHLRHAIRGAYEEMRDLWASTAEMVDGGASANHLARVLALWSCFQWSRVDVMRAAMIGLAVFVTAAAIGATTLDFDAEGTASARGNTSEGTEVRGGHTLDQHTGRKSVVHAKR
jgi:hypothetical protein